MRFDASLRRRRGPCSPHRPLVPLVLLAVAALLVACGGGSSAQLEIELAPTFDPGDVQGDRQCRPGARASLPSGVDCVTVAAFARLADGGAEPVRVLRPEDDHGAARTTQLFFPRTGDDNQIRFDVELVPGASHDLEIIAYADGIAYARGRAEGVRAGVGTIRVRLEPFQRWACAGGRDDGSDSLPRALHQSVALPNGDVLLIGGVTGETVQALSVEGGALLQRGLEVYDASEARFHEIAVTDLDGEAGIGAVFHRAFYVGVSDGRYRVRVVGGFTASDQPAARFDATQGLTQYGSPLLPGARAEVRDSIDLLYDAETRAIEVRLVDPGSVRRAGMNAVSEPTPEGLVVVALGLLDGGGAVLRPVPMIAGQWYSLPAIPGGATGTMLLAPRFGHTASRLDAGTVLVWGGDVTQPTIDDVAMRAGELLGAATGAVPASLAGLPPSTAFHTATSIQGGVLIAGGMEIAPLAGVAGGVGTVASAQPLTVVSPAGGAVAGVAVPFDGLEWPTPILHAVTALPDGSAIVTGGALRTMPPGAPSISHLWASDRVIVVRRDAVGVYTSTPLARMMGPRWGHSIAPLPGDRVLVTGGFVREGGTLRAISAAETLLLADPPRTDGTCGRGGVDGGSPRRDAGVPDVDASAPDLDAG